MGRTDADQAAGAAESGGTNTPTPAEQRDPGAHDRGGWLTLDEAAERFGVERRRLERALGEGRMAGRRVAGEGLAPPGVSPDAVVPAGATSHAAAPADDWLVQPDQVQRFLMEEEEAPSDEGPDRPGAAGAEAPARR
jgi:hypothetical protein